LPDSTKKDHVEASNRIVEEHFGKQDIDAIGLIRSVRYRKKEPRSTPSMLCLVDFTTKDGAEKAIQAVHNTEIEGLKVLLQPAILTRQLGKLIGRYDQALLVELQEKGLVLSLSRFDKLAGRYQGKKKLNKETEVEETKEPGQAVNQQQVGAR
jgi:hypothetical protein